MPYNNSGRKHNSRNKNVTEAAWTDGLWNLPADGEDNGGRLLLSAEMLGPKARLWSFLWILKLGVGRNPHGQLVVFF